ncbi:Protein plant cadmium resistance 6 [Vitis vinifera]|uniref:Protein plant cadmium resistance 6 n=1 Tax=Vitis vinifera TaxID=29760 RepID=A0A438JBU1_VITVI|nr:Protein plant cadmium resistance 6 [Vitis vinifera]
MQPGPQVPSQNPHAIPLDPVQPMQFPPQPGQNLSHTTHSSGQHLQSNPVQYPASKHSSFPNTGRLIGYAIFLSSNTRYNGCTLQQTAPVIMVQSQPRVTTVGTEAWTTGLFDCMDDPTNALVTCCVPCLTFGQVAEIVDNGHTSCGTSALVYGAIACLIGCPFLISCTYRTKLRSRYGLVESPAPDWVVHCLCDFCALCQEYRELQNRGFDPSIGWHANVARHMQQQQVAMVVPPNQTMIG